MPAATGTRLARRAGYRPFCVRQGRLSRLSGIDDASANLSAEEGLHHASDEQLLAMVVAGREVRRGQSWELAQRAWRHLSARHHDRVRGLVVVFRFPDKPEVRIAPDEFDDAAQECFIRAVKMLDNFRGVSVGEFLGALRTCVTNTCMDYCRRRLARERGIAGSIEEPSLGAEGDEYGRFDAALGAIAQGRQEEQSAARDELGALHAAISQLDNERMRQVLHQKMGGYSSAEISRELGLTVANVDQLCSRGVRRLKEVMSDD